MAIYDHRSILVALVPLLLITGQATTAGGAQFDGGFPIYGLVCDRDPGVTSPAQGSFPPEGCEGRTGIEMVVETADAQPIGSCTTDEDGLCVVDVPFDALVIVREKIDTIPEGYAPRANPILTWNYTEFAGAEFINVPEELTAATPTADSATLRIHSRVCPVGFAGADYDAACHDTAPDYEQTLFLDGPIYRTVTIDEAGNATFSDLPIGDYTLQPGLPEGTERLVTFCSKWGEPGVEYPSSVEHSEYAPPNLYNVKIDLPPHGDILCDLFAVPAKDVAPA